MKSDEFFIQNLNEMKSMMIRHMKHGIMANDGEISKNN